MIEGVEYTLPVSVELLKKDPQTQELLSRLDAKMLYHNFSKEPSKHTQRVMSAVAALSKREGLSYQSLEMSRISALYHDVSYPDGGTGHEERSAEISYEILRRFGFKLPRISIIQEDIRSTKGEFLDGAYITNPQTITQKILCDADMNLVGEPTEVFLSVGDLLRQEIGIDDKNLWYEGQIKFLQRLKWHTRSAFELWEPSRLSHIKEIGKILEEG